MNLNSAACDGRIVIIGLLSGPRTSAGIDLSPFLKQRIRIEGSRLRSRDVEYQVNLRNMLVRDALPKLVDGSLKAPIVRVFDWHDVQEAHRLMESNTIMGKIICQVT
jgi:NADPH:quinone reductase-like Zn-dependent oxidoreductase